MSKQTKRQKVFQEIVSKDNTYRPKEALEILRKSPSLKFDASVDLAMNLAVDSRKPEQMIRGTCPLPHGTGKVVRILVLALGEKQKEGLDAGADLAGADDMIEKIQGGFLDFDQVVATPDMMPKVAKIGKILGPRGLMPSPKSGSVTPEVGKAVKAIKSGQVNFRVDKGGVLHAPIGRVSFSNEQLEENLSSLITAVRQLRPQGLKGTYVKQIFLSSTMGPGIPLEV